MTTATLRRRLVSGTRTSFRPFTRLLSSLQPSHFDLIPSSHSKPHPTHNTKPITRHQQHNTAPSPRITNPPALEDQFRNPQPERIKSTHCIGFADSRAENVIERAARPHRQSHLPPYPQTSIRKTVQALSKSPISKTEPKDEWTGYRPPRVETPLHQYNNPS